LVKTAVLVSGGGTNLQAIIESHRFGKIKNCTLTAVISSKPDAYALTRAENAGIPTFVIDRSAYSDRKSFTEAVLQRLQSLEIELIVLAGFTYVLDPILVQAYENRIINIHPSLIPAFCGDGYYGLHVHEEAIKYGVKISGATAQFITSETDAGPIILQKAVYIKEDDTPKSLQRRIMEEAEWKILPEAISLYCEGRLSVEGRIVHIKEV
jgi:phosphoribosylglycinamide formyltransferase-1